MLDATPTLFGRMRNGYHEPFLSTSFLYLFAVNQVDCKVQERTPRMKPQSFQLLVWVIVVMMVILRTGEMFNSSTTRFTIMTAAILPQDHAPPQVAGQFEKFFRQRHGLIEIGKEVAKRLFCHTVSWFHYSKSCSQNNGVEPCNKTPRLFTQSRSFLLL